MILPHRLIPSEKLYVPCYFMSFQSKLLVKATTCPSSNNRVAINIYFTGLTRFTIACPRYRVSAIMSLQCTSASLHFYSLTWRTGTCTFLFRYIVALSSVIYLATVFLSFWSSLDEDSGDCKMNTGFNSRTQFPSRCNSLRLHSRRVTLFRDMSLCARARSFVFMRREKNFSRILTNGLWIIY